MPKIAVILLAAGHSRRFGSSNKLLADFVGKPILSAAVATLTSPPFCARVAAISDAIERDLLPGFETVQPQGNTFSQSDSLKAALTLVLKHRPDAALICLGDMPLVPLAHIEAVIAKFDGERTLVATQASGRAMPPALFGSHWFGDLLALKGDQGAKHLIHQATELVSLDDQYAIDIDTIRDLEQLWREQI